MKTPAGWALAGMWYDKYDGIPPPGSLLEQLFMLVYLQRQESELLATRALVMSILTKEDSKADPAIESFQKYCEHLFPFIERARDQKNEEERKALEAFVQKPLAIPLQPIYQAQASAAKMFSGASLAKRFALKR